MSESDPRPRSPDDTSNPETKHSKHFRNYNYAPSRRIIGVWVVLLQILCLALVGGVCFGNPASASGGFALLKDSDTKLFVGALHSCTGDECGPWMGSGTASTSSNANTDTSTTPTKRSLHARVASGIDTSTLPTFFVTTGSAALFAFWMLLFITLLTLFIRFPTSPPHKPGSSRDGAWSGFKRFSFRACLSMEVLTPFMVVGVALDCIRRGKGAGMGLGVIVLIFVGIIMTVVAMVELNSEKGRTQRMFMWLGCGMSCGILPMCICGGEAVQDPEKGPDIPMDDMGGSSGGTRGDDARRRRRGSKTDL